MWNTPDAKAGDGKCHIPQETNNCYNYATNVRNDRFAQPGHPNITLSTFTCSEIENAAAKYDGLNMIKVPCNSICPGDAHHQVALAVKPHQDPLKRDYHWYRKDSRSDGLDRWSHKPGIDPVTNLDKSGKEITDPAKANRGEYTEFCGCYCISTSVVAPHISGWGPPYDRC